MERNGDWIQTYTGRMFWPLDPRPEDVSLLDIAHALANVCRFAGHCSQFYSVAEHSLRVSQLLPYHLALWGLLHDASEAYLADLPRPLKYNDTLGDPYRIAEKNLMRVICQRFGLSPDEPPEVKHADTVLLVTEQRDLMARAPKPWKDKAEPLPERIAPTTSARAREDFLGRFRELQGDAAFTRALGRL